MPSSSAYTTAYTPTAAYGQSSQAAYVQPQTTAERSYTLGGDSYADAAPSGAQNPYANDAYFARFSGTSQMTSPYSPLPTPSPSHLDTRVAPVPSAMSPTSAAIPRGPRSPSSPLPAPQQQEHPDYEDSPPMYDDATAQPPGQWGAKH